jgi:hypothetical protein
VKRAENDKRDIATDVASEATVQLRAAPRDRARSRSEMA